ncbi:6-carboxytetrahydropterin synthase [Candidatus Pacearchaeota archaeon]|nr:6-carboxytetrahydropterin synthase [Candidatus Pacearchaeota archaeon]
MIIRKSFKFESAHRVRSSTCSRCKNTVHGHSYDYDETDVITIGHRNDD